MTATPSTADFAAANVSPILPFKSARIASQLLGMLADPDEITLFHRDDEGLAAGEVSKPVSEISAAIRAAREMAGERHVFADVVGIRLAFRDKASAERAAALMKPSYEMHGPQDSAHLVYLIDPAAGFEEVLEGLQAEDDDDAYTATDVPLPYGEYRLSDEYAAVISEGYRVFTADEIDAAFFAPTDAQSTRPTSRINDAVVWGEMSEEVANLPIVLSVGKNREVKEWATQKPARFADVFTGILSKHTAGKKDGNAFVTGSLGSSKKRTKTNVLANYMMGLDIDSGASLDKTLEEIVRLGITAVVYTTHSHGSTRIEVAYDKYHRWAQKNDEDEDPSTETVRQYLAAETAYVEDVCKTAEFVEKSHRDGMKIVIATRPIDKFRVMIPLKRPFVYAEQKGAHKDSLDLWNQKVLGMGRMLDVEVDRAARDPSRLFYLPRHAVGATNHRIVLVCGGLMDFDAIERGSTLAHVSNDPFQQAAHVMGGTARGQILSPTLGLDMRGWARERADGFDIAKVFRDHCDDRVRVEQNTDKLTVECPFDDDHSNPGDPEDQGTFVQSGGADAETFTFFCSHAGCHGRDRLTMLQKAMQLGWFPDDVLTDDSYDTLDREDRDDVASFDPGKRAEVFADVLTRARECAKTASEEVVGSILAACLLLKDTETSRVLSALGKSTDMRLSDLKAMLKERRDESADAKAASGSKTHFKTAAEAIAALNEEIAFVERGTGVMIVQKRPVLDGWKSIKAAEEIFRPWTYGKDDKQAFMAWKASPNRDHRTDIVFEPFPYGVDDPTPPDLYNMYRGFDIEPEAGDWLSYQRHVFHVVCGGDKRLFAYYMSWLAQMVQNPGDKPGTALVLRGLKGTGKGLFVEPLRQIWGTRHSVKVSDPRQLTGNFNGHMDAKILAVAEESFWGGDKKVDSVIKDMITSEFMMMERKFVDAVEARDCRRFIFLSNADNVIRATPDERRYAVTLVSDERKHDADYFRALGNEIKGGKLARAMLMDLLNLDIRIDLRKPPRTDALMGQILTNLPAEDRWIRTVLETGTFHDADGNSDLADDKRRAWRTSGISISKETVYTSYRSVVKGYNGKEVPPSEIGKFFIDAFRENDGGRSSIETRGNGAVGRDYQLPPLPEMIAAYEKKTGLPLDFKSGEKESDFIRVINPAVAKIPEKPSELQGNVTEAARQAHAAQLKRHAEECEAFEAERRDVFAEADAFINAFFGRE